MPAKTKSARKIAAKKGASRNPWLNYLKKVANHHGIYVRQIFANDDLLAQAQDGYKRWKIAHPEYQTLEQMVNRCRSRMYGSMGGRPSNPAMFPLDANGFGRGISRFARSGYGRGVMY